MPEWIEATFIDPSSALHNPEHEHLAQADIGFLWTVVENSRRGRRINAFIESFNGKFRAECLNTHRFLSLDDARSKNGGRAPSQRDWQEAADFAHERFIGSFRALSHQPRKFRIGAVQRRGFLLWEGALE